MATLSRISPSQPAVAKFIQIVATPGEGEIGDVLALDEQGGVWMYHWDAENSGWKQLRDQRLGDLLPHGRPLP